MVTLLPIFAGLSKWGYKLSDYTKCFLSIFLSISATLESLTYPSFIKLFISSI